MSSPASGKRARTQSVPCALASCPSPAGERGIELWARCLGPGRELSSLQGYPGGAASPATKVAETSRPTLAEQLLLFALPKPRRLLLGEEANYHIAMS